MSYITSTSATLSGFSSNGYYTVYYTSTPENHRRPPKTKSPYKKERDFYFDEKVVEKNEKFYFDPKELVL